MANKRIVVNVDIQAQAQQLTQIINQSKQSLQNLAPTINKGQYQELEKAFDRIAQKTNNLSTNLKTGLSSPGAFTTATKNINKLYEDYSNVIGRIQSMGIDPQKIIPDIAQPTKKRLDAAVSELKTKGTKAGKEFGENLQQALQQALGKGDIKAIKQLGQKAQAELTKANRSIISQTANVGKQYGTDAAGASKAIESELARVRAMDAKQQNAHRASGGKSVKQMETDLGVAKKYDAYKTQHGKIGSASAGYQKQATEIQQLTQNIRQLETELQKLAGPAQQQAQQGLNQLATSENNVKQQTIAMTNEVNKGANAFTNMSTKMSQMSQLKSYFAYMFSVTSIFMRMGQAVRNAIKDFKELDKQLNAISIVTGKSMDELWGGFAKLNSTAQKYGVVTSDVVSVQKLYYQQGRSVAEVNELTGETLTFAKISGLEFGEATEYMTAALNAYKIEAKDANQITDTYAALSMSAAVDAQELAVAMSKVASLASLSGSSLNDTSAYLTKIIETTREAPETAGTALKTVIARFTAVNKLTADQKELLDEDYNFNNIEKALKTVGIATKDSAGQMRGFSEIIGDLGPIWEDLDSNTKHYIATQAAGARQQSRFIALMDDWTRTEELMSTANDSAGTGAEQLELAMDSIDTKMNQLKATWQSLYGSFLSSDVIKGALELVTTILGGINSIIEGVQNLTSIIPEELGGLSAALSIMIYAMIIGLTAIVVKGAIKLGKTFGESFKAGYNATRFKGKMAQKAKEITEAYTQGVKIGRARALGEQVGEAGVTGNAEALKTARAGFQGLARSGGAAAAGAGAGLGKLAGTIGAVVSAAIPYILIALGAAAVVAAFVALAYKIEKDREKQSAREVSSSKKEIEDETKKTESLTKNYTKALKLHNKGLARSAEETEEYQKLLGELNEAYPQLVDKTADGLYKLTEASNEFYNSAIKASEAAIDAAHGRIAHNATLAGMSGVYAGTKGTELNDELKSVAAILGEQSRDQIKLLGESNFSAIKVDDITKMAEQGLTREAVNEFVAIDYMPDEFENLLNDFYELAKQTEDGIVDVNALGWRNTEALTWFNAINAQYGGDLISKLWEQTFGENVMKAEITNWEGFYEAQTGVEIPDEFVYNLERLTEKKIAEVQPYYAAVDWVTDGRTQVQATKEGYTAWIADKPYFDKQPVFDSAAEALEASARSIVRAEQIYYSEEKGQYYYTPSGGKQNENESTKYFDTEEEAVDSYLYRYGNLLSETELKQAYTQNISNDIKEALAGYSSLPEQIRQQYESYMKIIQQDSIGNNISDGEYVDNLINELNIELNNPLLSEALAFNLQSMLEDRTKLAEETIASINAKTGGSETINDFSEYTNVQLTHLSELLQKTFDLYGQTAAQKLEENYKSYHENVLSNNKKLRDSFANVDLFSAQSIAEYGAQALAYADDSGAAWNELTTLVNSASNATERATRSISELFTAAANDIKTLTDDFDKISDGLTGELDVEDAFGLITDYSSIFNLDMFKTTGDGFLLNLENSKEVAEQMLQLKVDEYRIEEAMLKMKQQSLEAELKSKITGTNVTEDDINYYRTMMLDPKQWNAEEAQRIYSALSANGLLADVEMLVGIDESSSGIRKFIDIMSEMSFKMDDDIQLQKDYAEKLVELLEKISQYADVDGYINYLNNNNDIQEFTREFSTNPEAIADATKQIFTNNANLASANLAKSERATVNAEKIGASLLGDYGDYISFDEHGNLLRNEEAMANWATELAKQGSRAKTEAEKEAYEFDKQRYDLMLERIDAYEEEHNLVQESLKDAQKALEANEKLTKELKESVTKVEDKFRDLFVKRDEEALESLRERYDAMKKLDEDYLESVREAIEEERRLRDRSNEEDDLAQMERKLELMRMSGGSATEIQALEKEITDKRQSMADARTDDLVKELETEAEKRSAQMDEEIAYQEEVLETKKENQILYNQEIAELMRQDKETIINTWKTLDSEFMSSTETNKTLLEAEMNSMVASGKAAKELLADQYILAIEEAYEGVKEATELDIKALKEYSDAVEVSNPGIINNVNKIELAYLGVYNVIDDIIAQESALNRVLSSASTYAKFNINKDEFSTPGDNDYEKEINKANGEIQPPAGWEEAKATFKGTSVSFKANSNDDLNAAKKSGIILVAQEDADQTYEVTSYDKINGGKVRNETVDNYDDNNWWVNGFAIGEGDIAGQYLVKLQRSSGWTRYIGYDDFIQFFKTQRFDGSSYFKFATGGMVDYTGPAWVDGTPSKPEAFLSAKDTSLIAGLRDVLRANPSFVTQSTSSIQKTGDTYYEIHINVDELGEGYSVDDLMDELEDRIVQSADKNTVIKIAR